MTYKILVIDDDESIVDAVSLILEDEGYTVEVTMKAEETFDKIDSFKPDIIILDVLMSGKDGRDICKKLKTDDATKSIPLIMISAHPTAKEGSLACGADAFIAKPFDTAELLAMIAQYIKK